jgi:hypothetical protein
MYDHRLRWSVPRSLPARVAGRTIDALERRSKYLLFRLSTDTLLVHFGMTGSLRAFMTPPPRRPHDHVDIVLDSGLTLRYHDPRRFGAMLWLSGPAEAHPLLSALGPEPFDPACNADYLWRASRRRKAAIKLALMDNHLVVGIGNIYANESLFRAGSGPTTPAFASRAPAGPGSSTHSARRFAMPSRRAARRFAITSTAAASPATSSSTTASTGARACLPALRQRHSRNPARRPRDLLLSRAASADRRRRAAARLPC